MLDSAPRSSPKGWKIYGTVSTVRERTHTNVLRFEVLECPEDDEEAFIVKLDLRVHGRATAIPLVAWACDILEATLNPEGVKACEHSGRETEYQISSTSNTRAEPQMPGEIEHGDISRYRRRNGPWGRSTRGCIAMC